MAARATAGSNWYDYPAYYDLAFRSETPAEADFIEAACRKYCPFPVRRLLEPACGTGRLVAELAARGYRPQRLRSQRAGAGLFAAPLGAARPAGDDLHGRHGRFHRAPAGRCRLQHLRQLSPFAGRAAGPPAPGVRGRQPSPGRNLHPRFPPLAAGRRRGVHRALAGPARPHASVRHAPRALDRPPPPHRRLRICLLVRKRGRPLRLRDEFPLRMYTAAQFRRLLAAVPRLELCDVYDFWYEIDHPLRLSDELSDTVFVLRRKAEGGRGKGKEPGREPGVWVAGGEAARTCRCSSRT